MKKKKKRRKRERERVKEVSNVKIESDRIPLKEKGVQREEMYTEN